MQRSSQIITNKLTPSFSTGWMPFLSPNQQRQSTEGRKHHISQTFSPQTHSGFFRPCLSPLKDYPGRRVANPLISLQHPAYSRSSHFSTTAYGSRQPFSVLVFRCQTTHLERLDGLVYYTFCTNRLCRSQS